MRSLDELTSTDDPAWPLVLGWVENAAVPVEVLPPDPRERGECLLGLQVSTRSPMGAVIYESGGMLIDGGWIRVLGSGHPRLTRSLPAWNRGRTWIDASPQPSILMVADDALGGLFAINGGGLPGRPGRVNYFAPDTLDWEDLDVGYSDFLQWALSDATEEFYAEQRWPSWREDVRELSGDQAFSIVPFLWTEGPAVGQRSRRAVPISETYALSMEFRRQLAGARGA